MSEITAADIMRKFVRGWHPMYRYTARDLAGASYAELVDRVRAADGGNDHGAGAYACAHIGAAIGATRMEAGATEWCLRALRGHTGDVQSRGRVPTGPLFDHCATFYAERRVIGILTRPYASAQPHSQALGLAGDPALAVWLQPTQLCSWCPGFTVSYLLTGRDRPSPGFDFERVG
jgi:hypothetical protein